MEDQASGRVPRGDVSRHPWENLGTVLDLLAGWPVVQGPNIEFWNGRLAPRLFESPRQLHGAHDDARIPEQRPVHRMIDSESSAISRLPCNLAADATDRARLATDQPKTDVYFAYVKYKCRIR